MQIFGGEVSSIFPSDGISFQSKLSKVVDILKRNEDGASQHVGEIDLAMSSIIEPKTNAVISDMLCFDDVQHDYPARFQLFSGPRGAK